MKNCSYCGRENEDTAAHCRECGRESFKPAKVPKITIATESSTLSPGDRTFFRLKPSLVILLVLTLLYCGFTLLNVVTGNKWTQLGNRKMAVGTYWTAFCCGITALLCNLSRHLLVHGNKPGLSAGLPLLIAFAIVTRTWAVGMFSKTVPVPYPILEACLSWVPMLYVLGYLWKQRAVGPNSLV